MARARTHSIPLVAVAHLLLGERTALAPGNSVVRTSLKRVNRKLKPAEIDTLCASYEAGASIVALALRFEIYHGTVRAHLTRRGVPIRSCRKPLSAEDRQLVRALRTQGLLYREIAEQLGCSLRSVRRVLAMGE